jgi:hypothetical protein
LTGVSFFCYRNNREKKRGWECKKKWRRTPHALAAVAAERRNQLAARIDIGRVASTARNGVVAALALFEANSALGGAVGVAPEGKCPVGRLLRAEQDEVRGVIGHG